jgi:hypothetical protein
MKKFKLSLVFVLLIIILNLFLVFGEDYSQGSGSTQNVVDTVSSTNIPKTEPTEYIYDNGQIGSRSAGVYDPDGKTLIARAEDGFKLTNKQGDITFENTLAGTNSEKVEFGDFAKDKPFEVSNVEGFAKITYHPNENTIEVDKASDVYIAGTDLKQISDAKIRADSEGVLDYAEFTSKKGGEYAFNYGGKDYIINAKSGDRIVFDPKNNKITGSSLSGKDMNFNLKENEMDTSGLLLNTNDKTSLKANDFEITLDENGGVKEISLKNGGTYSDIENNLDYSSKNPFSIFYDGKDIKNYEGNAVSVFNNENGLSIEAKGLVNINDLDKNILYQGKTAGVYTEYDYENSYFDVQNGEAYVSNGKHKVDIKNGLIINNDNLEYSGKEASPFSVSYSKDGNNKESLSINYLEKDGKIQTEAIYFKDGKENIVDLGNLAEQETRYAERIKPPTKEDIGQAIFDLNTNDPQYEKKLADLYATRGLISEQELSSYKAGQEVFQVSQSGYDRIGTIESVNGDGSFIIDGKTYTKDQLDKFLVSKLSLGQEVGVDSIKDISYDTATKQILYGFEKGAGLDEKSAIATYFSEDYKTAISYYQEAQKNPQLAEQATLGLAGVYQQIGDTKDAYNQYILLKNENLDEQTKSLVYKGLISNYFQEGKPNLALSTTFMASQENPNDASLAELNKQLTKSYLETINSAINTEDASILQQWKQKVGYDKNWYDVGLDQPIVSWFKEDINFATGFSRDQLSEQQKGILVTENLLDRGYSLNEIKSMSNNQISQALQLDDTSTINSIRTAIQSAFRNPDVLNLANGAKQSFQFETGTGYVDKTFLDKNWAEQILSDTNVKTTAEAVAIGAVSAPIARLATNAIEMSTLGSTTLGRALITPITIDSLKGLSRSLQTQSLIKDLATESGATLGKTRLAEGQVMSLNFDDVASVNNFMNKNVVGSTEQGIRIISKDAKAGQYFLEMNGQQFLTKVAGQDISGIMDSQLLSQAQEPLLLTSGSYATEPVTGVAEDAQTLIKSKVTVSNKAELEQRATEFIKTKGGDAFEKELDKLGWHYSDSKMASNHLSFEESMYAIENSIAVPETKYVFHGTSDTFLQSLKQNGLDNRIGPLSNDGVMSTDLATTYTGDIGYAESFADSTVKFSGGKPIIVRYPAEVASPGSLTLSKDFLGNSYTPVEAKYLEYSYDGGETWQPLIQPSASVEDVFTGGRGLLNSATGTEEDIRDFLASELENRKIIPTTTETTGVKINSYGEIITSVDDFDTLLGASKVSGEQYFTRGGEEYLNMQGPHADFKTLQIKPSVISPIVEDYINYLSKNELLNLPKTGTEKLIFVEGESPFAELTKEGILIWSGKPIEIIDANGVKQTLVFIDSRLSNSQKITTAFHELIHARGILNERETQLQTIRGLVKMMDTYPELAGNENLLSGWKYQEESLNILTDVGRDPTVLRDALNYAIKSAGEFDVSPTEIKNIIGGK